MKIVPALFLLSSAAACSEPQFEFRGFTDRSSCSQVLKAEEEHGAVVVETTVDDSLGPSFMFTKISTSVFDYRAAGSVICYRDDVLYSVIYVIGDNEPAKTPKIADRVLNEIEPIFGKAYDRAGSFMGHGRVVDMYFGDTGLVRLWEGNTSVEEGEHNVVLMVCPGCAVR